MKTTVARFGSWEEFIAAAEVVSYNGFDSGHVKGREDFYGTSSLKEAANLARTGWAEGAAKVLEVRATLASAVQSIVAGRTESLGFDVAGDYLDVGRHLSGEPECFGCRVDDPSQFKPVVRINVNTAVSGSVSQEAIFSRGAAILAAIDIIEAAGRRVELWIVNGSLKCNRKHVHETYVLVKSASQPLDCDRLAFALCHASTHRRLCFSVFEKYGITACDSYPHAVSETDGVTTREAKRGRDFTREELLDEIKWICDRVGVEIPADEITAL